MPPIIESLDAQGYPYQREAKFVNDLPLVNERMLALERATEVLAQKLNLSPQRRIPFGMPAYSVFMTQPEAKKHPERALLMTRGCDLSLDLCRPIDSNITSQNT